MSTDFLKDRYKTVHKDAFGLTTVKYYPYSPSNRDSLTGDVTESSAYSSTYTELSAQVNFSPSKALREKIGLKVTFDAVIVLLVSELTDDVVTINIGDKFILPGYTNPFYVKRSYKDKQVDDGFLDLVVAVSREIGSRG